MGLNVKLTDIFTYLGRAVVRSKKTSIETEAVKKTASCLQSSSTTTNPIVMDAKATLNQIKVIHPINEKKYQFYCPDPV